MADTGFIARYLNDDEETHLGDLARWPVAGLILHVGEVTEGQIAVGEKLQVDVERRMGIAAQPHRDPSCTASSGISWANTSIRPVRSWRPILGF